MLTQSKPFTRIIMFYTAKILTLLQFNKTIVHIPDELIDEW